MAGIYNSKDFGQFKGMSYVTEDMDTFRFETAENGGIMTINSLEGDTPIGVRDVVGISPGDFDNLRKTTKEETSKYPAEWDMGKKITAFLDAYIASHPLAPGEGLKILAIPTDEYAKGGGRIFHLSKVIEAVEKDNVEKDK